VVTPSCCHVYRLIYHLYDLVLLSYTILEHIICFPFGFWRVSHPVVLPSLIYIQFVYNVVNFRKMSLCASSDQMAFLKDVFVEVLVVVSTHLTVVVVLLGFRNRNAIHRVSLHSFGHGCLLNEVDVLLLFEKVFDFFEPFDSVHLLLKRLAWIHTFGTVCYQVQNVIR